MKQLDCRILFITEVLSGEDYTYGVFDGEDLIATGVSSNTSFVKEDAGGYHTKNLFDKMYPDGWNVNFNF